jgi:glycosyltransferase involved in cell wall biosynthesis
MLDFTKRVFIRPNQSLQPDAKIIFVSDMFASDYEGGAELTTEALLESSPLKIHRIRSRELSAETVAANVDKYWIFGNFSQVDPSLLTLIAQRTNYSVLEYDYKFCKYRSIEKHQDSEGKPCDCQNQPIGKLISTFYSRAKSIFWMSVDQQERYFDRFPSLRDDTKHIVLSSVFSKKHLSTIASLRSKYQGKKSDKWVVLGSNSWIKGFEDAQKWAQEQGYPIDVLWNVPYDQALERMAQAEGFVYLPRGGDTCPRMVIEAKLLGCKLHLNSHVQNASEKWFSSDEPETISKYLEYSPGRFWDAIRQQAEKKTTISGYTQTRNCIEQNYPWEESIGSLLGFCDEVVIVDGGSTDGTWERLLELQKLDPRIKPFQHVRDWNDKRFALFNGQQKAVARERCTGDFLWQVDIDEVVHESDYDKIRAVVAAFPKEADLLALPVIEYWGDETKIRVDVNPWKWRLSRNNPRITHGLPKDQRLFDKDGTMYSAGSDGDDYIYKDTLERVPFATFYQPDVEGARQAALQGNPQALEAYTQWFNQVCVNVPGVYHYSWYDLERKIHTYKNFWSKHWTSLYNHSQEDTAANNKFFDKPWSQVSDDEIRELAIRMKDKMGGWIFHNRIDFSKPTPWIRATKPQPACMQGWCDAVKKKLFPT